MELNLKQYMRLLVQLQPRKLFIVSLAYSIFSQLCFPSVASISVNRTGKMPIPQQAIPQGDFSWHVRNLSPNPSPTRRGEGEVPPSLQGKGGRGLDFALASTHNVNSQIPQEVIEVAVDPLTTPNVNPNALEQLPSVNDLSDVKPTDWAYQALKLLMERYGIVSAYPDRTFRGNKPMTRYEFAAALATTLDKIEGILADAIGDEYVRQDAITIRRLQKEYASVLEQVRKRIDTTEYTAAELEANQFSTTTKLQGQHISAITGGSSASSTIVSRTRLNLITSFNNKDLLVTQLESGNNGGDAVAASQREGFNLLGSVGLFANAGGLDYTDVESDLKLRRLYYTFRPQDDLAVTVGAKMVPRDFIDKNSYANDEALDFSSGVFLNNPLIVQNQIDRAGGAGVAVAWNPKDSKFTARGLYIAADGNQLTQGISSDRRQASVEVEYAPSNQVKLKLQYTNAQVNDTDINAVGVNAEYKLNLNTGFFGRVGYGSYEGFNTAINRNLDAHPLSWSVGLQQRNLVIPGTLAGVAIGQPFVTGDLGNATQTNFEAFYNLKLSDNISVTPIFTVVTNPDNDKDNGTIWQSTLRTVFSF
jgi:Carbohydrate-selective porin, OprB family/S-layer homology domain